MHRFPKRPAVTVSAFLVLLTVTFSYLFTIGVAAACVYLPLRLLAFLSRTHQFVIQAFLLAIGGMIIAIVMLWSIFPRKQRFVEPGVALDLSQHPRLQDLIRETTWKLNERLPDRVYLTPYANASVTEHGGCFGFGSKRVLTIGLPLLATLTTSEFRAVLAHECAHFYGGDTMLLPLEHAARMAMGRVLATLFSDSGLTEALCKIRVVAVLHDACGVLMSLYWRALMKLTSMVSRSQEFRCDELACYLAGACATRFALEKVERVAILQDEFWTSTVFPLLERSVLPGISASLAEFLANPDVSKSADLMLQQRLADYKTEPDATHPPLRQRLDRIRRFQEDSEELTTEELAISLINDVEAQELALVTFFFVDASDGRQLTRLDWDHIAQQVYVPEWRYFVDRHSALLQGIRMADVPDVLNNPDRLVQLVGNPPGRLLTREQRADTVREVIIAAALLRLLDAGWICLIRPGARCFIKGAEQLEPWAILRQSPCDRARWEKLCTEEGILETSLHSSSGGPVALLSTIQSGGV